jgi:tRNA(Ile2) C34 agmatinyltransferase TiaS
MPKIIKNACRCKKCGTYLESTHRHDYRTCECPARVMVDGGKEYTRRGWNGELGSYSELVEDLSEYEGE